MDEIKVVNTDKVCNLIEYIKIKYISKLNSLKEALTVVKIPKKVRPPTLVNSKKKCKSNQT